LAILKAWMPRTRWAELNEYLLSFLNSADDDEAIPVLRQLKRPPAFISRVGAKSCVTDVHLRSLEDDPELDVEGLIDSGAENSYIHSDFVTSSSQLLPSVLAYPIGVYNADGTLNANGSITHFVDTILRIQDHSEVIRLYITNLGS
ncbi:hypothetical protein DFP72DRAFT_773622, partial [Ephemerocybe angulata]